MKKTSLAAALAAGLALPAFASPHSCAVPADRATLQAAFDDADCQPVQVSAGTFFGSFTIQRSVTVHGAGAGATILDGQNLSRVLTIDDPAELVILTGLTIQHGNAHGSGFNDIVGGGIASFSGALVLNDCDVSHNAASTVDDRAAGGGIYSDGGDLSLLHTTVTANTSAGYSGGVEAESLHAIVVDSTISGNRSRTFSGGIGADGLSLDISRSLISGNTVQAGPGGGITAEGGPLAIDHSVVSGNHAGDYGGGIVSEAGNLVMIGCTVSNNVAAVEQGGGVVQAGLGLLMLRSTISGNHLGSGDGAGLSIDIDAGEPVLIESSTIAGNSTGSGRGGGIFLGFRTDANPSIVGSTIAGNAATSAGGIFGSHTIPATTTIDLGNTIVAANGGGDCGPLLRSLGHNLSKDSSCPFTVAGDQRAADPKLGALAVSFPGANATMPLGAGSPAIDAGSDTLAPPTDERGIPRGGAHSDVGAFELPASNITVIPVEEVFLRVVGNP